MTQAQEPNDRNNEANRQIRSLNRRVQRLEYSQITPQELSESFERVYEEIDALEDIIIQIFDRLESELNGKIDVILRINQRLDWLEARFDRLEMRFNDLDRKFDLAISQSRDGAKISDD